MGLSTYLKATRYYYESMDSDYQAIADALEDIVPTDLGVRHNSTRNIGIEIPVATWHKGYTIDSYLWSLAGEPDSDEYELREDFEFMLKDARAIVDDASNAGRYRYAGDDDEWVRTQFLRLERALTDLLISDKLNEWTLKVWRSY